MAHDFIFTLFKNGPKHWVSHLFFHSTKLTNAGPSDCPHHGTLGLKVGSFLFVWVDTAQGAAQGFGQGHCSDRCAGALPRRTAKGCALGSASQSWNKTPRRPKQLVNHGQLLGPHTKTSLQAVRQLPAQYREQNRGAIPSFTSLDSESVSRPGGEFEGFSWCLTSVTQNVHR